MKEKILEMKTTLQGRLPLSAMAVILVGCMLLMLPGEEGSEEAIQCRESGEDFELSAFEERLESVLARVAGAGSVDVLLSLDAGSRKVLAQDREQGSTTARMETVTVNRGGGEQEAITLQTYGPTFRGAVVLCEGAGDPTVRLMLSRAVSVLTGLGTDRICVCEGVGTEWK